MIGASQNAKAKKKEEDLTPATKNKVDFGPLLETSIPQNRDLALKEGKLGEAIENLLAVFLNLISPLVIVRRHVAVPLSLIASYIFCWSNSPPLCITGSF